LARWRRLYRQPQYLYCQRSLGVIDGTCTHLDEGHGLAPRLLRPRPPRVRSGGLAPPSLGYQPSTLTFEIRAGTHTVWVTGIAPAASSSRTTRSTTELHPETRSNYFWSGRLDLHQRFLGSGPSALAAGLRPEENEPCLGAGDGSSGCHTTRRPGSRTRTRHAASESNAASPVLETRPVPDGDV
jgi:hypothetical protein